MLAYLYSPSPACWNPVNKQFGPASTHPHLPAGNRPGKQAGQVLLEPGKQAGQVLLQPGKQAGQVLLHVIMGQGGWWHGMQKGMRSGQWCPPPPGPGHHPSSPPTKNRIPQAVAEAVALTGTRVPEWNPSTFACRPGCWHTTRCSSRPPGNQPAIHVPQCHAVPHSIG